MNLLVIGNGFDLAHDLPTSYSDFLGFITYFVLLRDANVSGIERYKEAENFKKLNIKIQEYLLKDKVRDKDDELMKELYKLSAKNIWINHLKNCSEKNKLKGENWIDFEYEISKIIKGLEYYKACLKDKQKTVSVSYQPDNKPLHDLGYEFLYEVSNYSDKYIFNNLDFNMFHDDSYAKKIINELNCELEALIKCLEIFLEDVVEKIDIDEELSDIKEIKPINKLISFNYTNTYKRIYDKSNDVECDYIHGSLNISEDNKENNMVLGINEYLENGDDSTKLDFIQFKKYFQRIYKKTGCRYKEWLEKIKNFQQIMAKSKSDRNNIYFYGHSLDITDKDIIVELLMFPNTQTTIFYYDNDDYIQKIRNVVALISPNELIDRVYGAEPRIVFKEIKKSCKNS